jgi:hypothetical protein
MIPIDFSALIAGIATGLGSALLFRWVSARIPCVDFWRPAAILARSLTDLDEENFLSQYGQLLKLLGRYLGRQTLTLALPCAVVATTMLLILPRLTERSDPSLARQETPVVEGFSRPAAQSIRPSPVSEWISLSGLKGSDFAFLLPLCVGHGVGFVLTRRKG